MKKKAKKKDGYATRLGPKETMFVNLDETKNTNTRIKPGDPGWVGYKFKFTSLPPIGTIDSSAARDELAKTVGYGGGECSNGNSNEQVIKDLLVEEIRRLRQELRDLKNVTKDYLSVLEKEKEQNASIHTK